MDLGPTALYVATLLTGLEVLPPAAICHLLGQQKVTSPGDFCTGHPVENKHKTVTGDTPAFLPALGLSGVVVICGGLPSSPREHQK